MVDSIEWYKITHSREFCNSFSQLLEDLGYGAFAQNFILGIWLAKQDYSLEEPNEHPNNE